jgi:hypothetical protein
MASRTKKPGVGSGNNQWGNKNALRHGGKLNASRLTVGLLPRTMISVKREALAYRRAIEAKVVEAKGEIGLTDAHLVDTAASATMQAGICRWLLRNKIGTMSVADIRACSSDIVRAKERRDAAVRLLNLDKPPADPWQQIDARIISANGEAP